MTDNSTNGNVQTDPVSAPQGSTPAAQDQAPAQDDQRQAAPADESRREAAEDAVYEQAFDKIMAPVVGRGMGRPQQAEPDAPPQDQSQDKPQDQAPDDEGKPSGAGDWKPTSEQVQLLKRLHMTPEMIASWTDQQRQEFLDNAAKRERDNTSTYQQLRQRLDELESKLALQGRQTPDGGGQDGADDNRQAGASGQKATPDDLIQQAEKAVDEAVEVFGDEIKPLGTLTVAMAKRLHEMAGLLQQSQQAASLKDQLIAEMVLDVGIRDLVGDFPSLNTAEARQQVIARFEADWKSGASPHRQGSGPFLQRIRSALRDAAQAEFGQTSEAAAQVNLVNRTKERLNQQPQAGSGKDRPAPPRTEDELYDRAFDKHLAPIFFGKR